MSYDLENSRILIIHSVTAQFRFVHILFYSEMARFTFFSRNVYLINGKRRNNLMGWRHVFSQRLIQTFGGFGTERSNSAFTEQRIMTSLYLFKKSCSCYYLTLRYESEVS